jgi:2-polyprenyl-3-methyl-5-hydroxy-6-metoxy-1,4-benzoquinol methylase
MSDDPTPADPNTLNDEGRAIWDQNAAAWDAAMGAEGGRWQREMIAPINERLLEIQPGQRILDIACGNGAFARRMAALGAQVVASDFSAALIERAQGYPVPGPGGVTYQVVDATSEEQLRALGADGSYDAAVSTMALMDMPVIAPLLAALARLLKPGGRFVFSVQHPSFNTHAVTRVAWETERGHALERTYAMQVTQYLGLGTATGIAIRDQPALQYYFQRPLSVLFNTCFAAGFAMDALEEPPLPPSRGPVTDSFDWANYREFPPVLVARMRLLPG